MSFVARPNIGIAFVLANAVAGCAAHHHATTTTDDETTALAQDGADTSSTENDTETLSTSFVAASSATLTLASEGELSGGSLHVSDFGDGVRATYSPAGCVTVTNDAAARTAQYIFKECSGPYGLLDVTGTVKVTYRLPVPASAGTSAGTSAGMPAGSSSKMVLDFTGTQLKMNRATVDWSAHAEIATGAHGKREMSWRAQLAGLTARGREFRRTNVKTVSWTLGQQCVLVNGYSDGNVTGRSVHTDVLNYSRCVGECPATGSEIRITNGETGKSIDIKYDGGRSATFTGPSGGQLRITLACGL